jgi:hypothetical protein
MNMPHDEMGGPGRGVGATHKSGADMEAMGDMNMDMSHAQMTGMFGPYPMTREASARVGNLTRLRWKAFIACTGRR